MKHHPALALVLLATALLITSLPCSAAVYVKADSPGPTLDGGSWDRAFHTVQAGLDAASSGGEVWVAAGTYIERITLKDGVRLYGGFSGQESALGERDFETYETILDGNREGAVVTAPEGATQTTRIDGFTIRNSGSGMYTRAGIYCPDSSSPTIINNTITGNGTGVQCWNSSAPLIISNAIRGNNGGISCLGSCSPMIADNTISDNPGLGITCWSSSPNIIHNTITGSGAAIDCTGSSSPMIAGNTIRALGTGIDCLDTSSPTITGNVISGNGSGVICWHSSCPTITNNMISRGNYGVGCLDSSAPTITNNTIGPSGTGIYSRESASLTVTNNILAFNHSAFWSNGGTAVLQHNCVYASTYYDYFGDWSHPTDISCDPLFVDPGARDYRLRGDSPCIDAGTNDAAPDTDLLGEPRPVDGDGDGIAITDIGAYEYALVTLDIDVLPGDSRNVVKLKENRVITVAVLGSAEFDVTTIDAGTVRFGTWNAVEVHRHAHMEDANGDGIADLIFHFRCMDAGLQVGDTTVRLTARLLDGSEAIGTDTVTVKSR